MSNDTLTAGRPAARAGRPAGRLGRRRRRENWQAYLFLLPLALLFGGFTLWPIVASYVYAFFDWDGIGPLTQWIGLANFEEVLRDAAFWNAFWHSLAFSLAALLIEAPLALLLAILLDSAFLRGRNLYRLAFFLPVVATTAVVGIVIAVLLDPVSGVVNQLITALGLPRVNFLGSPATALPTVIAADIWKGFGITLIYWLAALQTVPPELGEAARLDGAKPRQQFFHVTLPVLAPMAIVVLLLVFQRSLNTFDIVQVMTKGGPVFSTDVVPTYIYRIAFNPEILASRYGFASAAGVVFGLLTLVITVGQALVLRLRRGKELS
ncbi:sugar ABC transporter permease [Leifsonia sp. H3M29-4]|uniref:carbohydrate ABC transporter permease n=1 Tax=Salinibacterium metalliresistens TaxID=3031321 RepID=UPI0023DC888D|nr:sugar ABC transporter permease [Salinibacterium metalliresistens]MDF1478150.1 sugar ABC transporter permease [Salinibacterium metalliresistens]